jgi:hypothetical protein
MIAFTSDVHFELADISQRKMEGIRGESSSTHPHHSSMVLLSMVRVYKQEINYFQH